MVYLPLLVTLRHWLMPLSSYLLIVRDSGAWLACPLGI